MSNRIITAIYQNTRGLNSKTDAFFTSVSNCESQLIAVTKTWIQDGLYSYGLFNKNYVIYRKHRNLDLMNLTRGGGVLLGVRHDITASKINLSTMEDLILEIDILGQKLHLINHSIYVFVLYMPNNLPLNQY